MRKVTNQWLIAIILCLTFSPFMNANNSTTTVCGTGTLTMKITFDDNPGQVAWQIKDTQDNIFAWYYTNSNYSSGDIVIETIPYLPAGDYVLIVFDSGADGLCCTHGTGSFELIDGQQSILLSGGIYEGSSVQPFCVGTTNNHVFDLIPPTASVLTASNPTTNSVDLSWTASTDNDAIIGYVFFVNGVYVGDLEDPYATSIPFPGLSPNTTYDFFIASRDLLGNFSPMSNIVTITTLGGGTTTTATILHEAYFENNSWDGWADGGNDASLYNGTRSFEGTGSILLRDNSGLNSSMTSPAFDLTGSDSVNITFQYFTVGFEQGEDFFIKLKQGNSWVNIAQFAKGTDFTANGFYEATVTMDADDYTFGMADRLRIQADASDNSDKIYVDQVIVTAYSTTNSSARPVSVQRASRKKNLFKGETNQRVVESIMKRNSLTTDITPKNQVSIFPNPAKKSISLQGIDVDQLEVIMIYDNYGKLLLTTTEIRDIDLGNMGNGVYHLMVLGKDKKTQSIRFVKVDE